MSADVVARAVVILFVAVAYTKLAEPSIFTRVVMWANLLVNVVAIPLNLWVYDDTLVVAVANAAAVALFARWLWRNRRRKDRKPSKVAGVVRDLGHRLTVAPVPAGAT